MSADDRNTLRPGPDRDAWETKHGRWVDSPHGKRSPAVGRHDRPRSADPAPELRRLELWRVGREPSDRPAMRVPNCGSSGVWCRARGRDRCEPVIVISRWSG